MSRFISTNLAIIAAIALLTTVSKPSVSARTQSAPPSRETSGNYADAIAFILKAEGGCSDHVSDLGGRTYMGITAEVAKRYGVSDPCTLSRDKVLAIFKAEYWDKAGCDRYRWPLNLVCGDTAYNFGLKGNGRTSQGWESLSAGIDLDGDPKSASLAIIKRRKAWRVEFVRLKPSQSVFKEGWDNRDNALQKKVEGSK